MRKFVCILTILSLLSSCVPTKEVVKSDNGLEFSVVKFIYNDHEYISFSSGQQRNGFVHNPECKYGKQ